MILAGKKDKEDELRVAEKSKTGAAEKNKTGAAEKNWTGAAQEKKDKTGTYWCNLWHLTFINFFGQP